VPVLVGLGAAIDVRRVLELGSGDYSTGVFLDRAVFPALELLDSVETNPEWGQRVNERFGQDRRLSLSLVDGSVSAHIADIDFAPYDVILVDDSDTLEARSASIRAVCGAVGSGPLVVVHDAEIHDYRRAAKGLGNSIRFTTFTPQTLVGWRGRSVHEAAIRAGRRAIERVDPRPAPTDVAGWARILGGPDRRAWEGRT
jgi:hypothetical protein